LNRTALGRVCCGHAARHIGETALDTFSRAQPCESNLALHLAGHHRVHVDSRARNKPGVQVTRYQEHKQKEQRKAKLEREGLRAEKRNRAGGTSKPRSEVDDSQAAVDLDPKISVSECFDDSKFADAVRGEKDLAVAEARDNIIGQKRQFGQDLTYGSVIHLWQKHSRRFLRVSPTNNSRMEPANMRVELHDVPSGECLFRIMPRYKVRSVGDKINQKDEIVLESVSSRGQYLNTNNLKLVELGVDREKPEKWCIPDAHEVNLAVSRTSFLISLFNRQPEHVNRKPAASGLEACVWPWMKDLTKLYVDEVGHTVRIGTRTHADPSTARPTLFVH